jgi:flagellar hook assembly protein FlgD
MVAKESPVSLTIYNLKGERVRTLVHGSQKPGVYLENWNGRNDAGRPVAAGVYFCHIRIADYLSIKKMIKVN